MNQVLAGKKRVIINEFIVMQELLFVQCSVSMVDKRHLLQFQVSSEPESTTEEWLVEEPPTGVSLGEILGQHQV